MRSSSLPSLLATLGKIPTHELSQQEREVVRRALNKYNSDDPVAFCQNVLKMQVWSRQAEIMRALLTHNRIAVRSGHKIGKLLAPGTPIPTPLGWRRYEELKVGDEVFSDTGSICRVTGEAHWKDRPLMRVTFEDGSYVDADERHEWCVRTRESRKRKYKEPEIVETRDLRERLTVPNGHDLDGTQRRVANFTVETPGPLEMPEVSLPLHPYVLGVWLGDGYTAQAGYCKPDRFIADEITSLGYEVTDHSGGKGHGLPGLLPVLRELKVLGNKHVPNEYLWASKDQRLALLQGLCDTDGHCTKKGLVQFTNTKKQIAESVLYLARSLGIKARIQERRAQLDGEDYGPYWSVSWCSPVPVFRLPRKLARLRTQWEHKSDSHHRLAIVSVEPLPGRVDSKCIEVDSPSHLFLCGPSMVPTHNSRIGAAIALWWVCKHPQGRVIMTAPTYRQMQGAIWREVGQLYKKSKEVIGGKINKAPSSGLTFEDDREIKGFSTNDPDKFSGMSGAELLFIVDEGSGVDETIFDAIDGNRAGGASLIVFGNPTQQSGTFHRAFHGGREGWHLIHVSSEESPNVTGEMEIPGLATREWIEERRKDWGENSPRFDIRVKGNFPVISDDAVIGQKSVDDAIERWKEGTPPDPEKVPLEIGVDVARFGSDETVIQPVRGRWAYEPIVLYHNDAIAVAGKVREVAMRMRHGEEIVDVRVDVIGVGAGVADILKTFEELRAIDVNVAEAPTIEEEPGMPGYDRLRDQLWFGLKAWLDDGGCIPHDEKLAGELLAPKYKFTLLGKLKVESKEEMKKEERLKRSPDRADALCLAVYKAPSTIFDNWRHARMDLI